MKKYIYILIVFCLAACQTDKDYLSIGDVIEKELIPPSVHSYKIKLDKDNFFTVVVNQQGIDIKVNLLGPEGNKISEFDSPNGKWGTEFVSHFTEESGIYTIELHPLDEDEPKGQYTLELQRKEARGTTPQRQVDQLFASWDRAGIPGAAVSVARNGEILYSNGYGYANLEYDIPITSSTIFHIASVSKQFTAFSIAMLADQGKISLDDDIRKYLPELNDFGETITIRHLIHHTSGLRDQWNLLAMAGWRLDDVITRDQILRLISHQKDLNFKPGDEMVYCNTGYTLMAEIVSRVSGQSFADWTRENIFIPLNMDNTLFYDDHEMIVPNRAYSYGEEKGGYKKSVLSYANVGATSLFTTVDDIQQWADNFRAIKVGNENVMKMMDERGILNNGDTLGYAFGQGHGKYKGLSTRTHSGGDAGYRTFLVRFPDLGYSISVFSNLGSFNTARLAYEVADIYLKDDLHADEDTEEANQVEDEETVEVPDSLLEEYAGRYLINESILLEFLIENEELSIKVMDQPNEKLTARSDSVFVLPTFDVTIIFKRNSEGKIDRFKGIQGGGEFEANKLPPFDPEGIDFEKFAGTYYSNELQTAYLIKVDNDTLTAFHQRHDPIKLNPIGEDDFVSNTWFFGTIEFTYDERGTVNGCLVSSGRVRNVYFGKVK